MIVTLRPFAHGWPGAMFFTIENEGRKREGFKNDRISSYGPAFHAGSLGRLCGFGLGLEAVVGGGKALIHQSPYRQTPDPPP